MAKLPQLESDQQVPYVDPSFRKNFPEAYDHLVRIGRRNENSYGKHDSIHRIIKLDYLIQLIGEKEMPFMNPKKAWKDPFENPLSNLNLVGSNGKEVELDSFVNNVYGSCWTAREETDYMWDYYTEAEENAVMIESTPMRLLGNILKNTDKKKYKKSNEFLHRISRVRR